MPISVLTPVEIVGRCYLSEALLWVAFQRFPLVSYYLNGCDVREDSENLDGIEPHVPDETPVTDAECRRAGLSLNPEYERFISSEYLSGPEHYLQLLKIKDLSADDRARFEAELEQSAEHVERLSVWFAEFDSFIDIHKSKLFVALREGRISSYGKKLRAETTAGSLELLEAKQWEDWEVVEWEEINADFWRSDKIDWIKCHAEGKGSARGLILVDTEELIAAFPPPLIEQTMSVFAVGDGYLFAEQSERADASAGRQRGRKPFSWDEFHVEMARRIRDGALPDKQEALIADLQAWCRSKWNRDVGRSTILQKVKPYYDGLT